jgi:hypothetical protein
MIESDERYTPEEVLGPLRRVFGELWDPCPRNDIYRGGLVEPWQEKCFVNPPYSKIGAWAEKAVLESRCGFVAFLIPNDCSTRTWQLLKAHSWGQWDIPFRVKFGTPDGRKVDVARSHVVFFLGGLK